MPRSVPDRSASSSASDAVLSPVALHTLLALAAGPSHGYAIAQEVEDTTNHRVRMGPGTLYGAIHRLAGQGLIAETETPDDDSAHASRRRYYRLTPAGAAALRREVARLERVVDLAGARLGL